MTMRRVFTTALLVGTGLIGTFSITPVIQVAYAQDGSQPSPGFGPDRQGRMDEVAGSPRGHGFHGDRLPPFCENGGNGEHFERMSTYLESNLDLTAAQQEDWNAVLAAVDQRDLAVACQSEDREALHAAGEQLREPLHTFFSSLSDDQKAELRTLMREQRDRAFSPMGELGDGPINRWNQR